MHSRLLVSGLPRSLPSLPRSPAPPCLSCVERQQRIALHSSEFPPTTAPLQTLHMDVWGPAPVSGTDQERYFQLMVDDYTRYTTVFPLRHKADGSGVLIPWIHATRHQLRERFRRDLPVLQTSPTLRWTGKIGDASVFQVWGALSLVRDAKASKLSSRTLRCVLLGLPTDAPPWQFYHPHSHRVFSSQDVIFDESVYFYRLHPHASHPGPAPSGVSQVDPSPLDEPVEISSDSSGPAEGGDPAADDTETTRRSPRLETLPGFPPRPSSPPQQPAAVESGAAAGGDTRGEGSGGAETEGEGSGGAATGGADSGGAASPSGSGAKGDPDGGPGARQPQQHGLLETLSPQQICAWIVRRGSPSDGGYGVAGSGAASLGGTAGAGGAGGTTRGTAGAGGARGTVGGAGGAVGAGGAGATSPSSTAGIGGTGGAAGAGGAGGAGVGGAGGAGGAGGTGVAGGGGAAGTGGAGAAGAGGAGGAGVGATAGVGGTGAAGAGGAGGAGAATAGGAGLVGALCHLLGLPPAATEFPISGTNPPLIFPPEDQSLPQLLPHSPLPAPAPYTECRETETRASVPARVRRVRRPRAPTFLGTYDMTLRPSSLPQPVVLPSPPASSLPDVADPPSNLTRASSPTVTRFLAIVMTDPTFSSPAASALVAKLVDFAAAYRLDYLASLDTQEELECLAAAVPHLATMLLTPEGDPDALDIPTPRSYREAILGEYSSQWQTTMDAEMVSWKSTGTYVDEVPPLGANIVSGMWIIRVKRPPGSPLAFKARYVARGFSHREVVDFFQTFSPTLKMTTLWVLLHIADQRDYELHSLDFLASFLQGSLHKAIWLRCPPGFTGSFRAGTQWSLRRPVYGLRQAPREWHDTLKMTLAALGFAPSTADLSLFLRTDTTLPPFYVLVYIDDLVFAIADMEALALVKAELQERHTCTDLGPSVLRLPDLLATAYSSIYWRLPFLYANSLAHHHLIRVSSLAVVYVGCPYMSSHGD
ncbi:unnamed protein product [Closterium sp. NIES-53]